MLKEHLQVCREDDDVDILELGRMGDIDSEDEEDEDEDEDEDNVDDPDYNTDSTSPSGIHSFNYLKYVFNKRYLNF